MTQKVLIWVNTRNNPQTTLILNRLLIEITNYSAFLMLHFALNSQAHPDAGGQNIDHNGTGALREDDVSVTFGGLDKLEMHGLHVGLVMP